MKHVPKRRILEIMTKIDCPQDFACYESGFKNVCKRKIAEYDESPDYTQAVCNNNTDKSCTMRVSDGNINCCRCPLRLYVATYLNNLAALEGSSHHLPSIHEKDTDPKT